MEAAVANVTTPGARVLVVVTGYFGDRLAQIFQRYGATVTRVDVEWGRACDPAAVERALAATPADIVAVVHAETSTGVLNPVEEIAGSRRAPRADRRRRRDLARRRCRSTIGAWGIDACYSCTQKGLGAPSGLAPIVFSARALSQQVACAQLLPRPGAARGLLGSPQVSPHDLRDARLRAATKRSRSSRRKGSSALGASRAEPSRACSPASTRSASRCCRRAANGCGRSTPSGPRRHRRGGRAPHAARGVQHRDWRGAWSARRAHLARRPDGRGLDARQLSCSSSPRSSGCSRPAATACHLRPRRRRPRRPLAASEARRRRRSLRKGPYNVNMRRGLRMRTAGRFVAALFAVGFACAAYIYLTLPDVRAFCAHRTLRRRRSSSCARMRRTKTGEQPRRVQRWVNYGRISPHLKRAVLVDRGQRVLAARGRRFRAAAGVDGGQPRAHGVRARRQHHHAAAREEPLPLAVEESGPQGSANS